MSKSFFKCESNDRFVVVWPCVTGESGFYDVVYGDTDEDRHPSDNVTVTRVTAGEAAAYVITELGCPLGVSLRSLSVQIATWRDEFESSKCLS